MITPPNEGIADIHLPESDTPLESFETMVDGIIEDLYTSTHSGKYIREVIEKSDDDDSDYIDALDFFNVKTALLAAHQQEIERIIETSKDIWLTRGNEDFDAGYIKGREDLRAEQLLRANLPPTPGEGDK